MGSKKEKKIDSGNNLGKILQKWRKQRKMTQEDLSDKTGISFHAISSIERGINMPTLKTLEKIAEALNIPISSFYEVKSKEQGEREIIINEITGILHKLKKEELDIVVRFMRSFG